MGSVEWTKIPGCEEEVSWMSYFGDLATTFFKGCKNLLYQTFVQPFSRAAEEIRQAREEKIQRASDYLKEIGFCSETFRLDPLILDQPSWCNMSLCVWHI